MYWGKVTRDLNMHDHGSMRMVFFIMRMVFIKMRMVIVMMSMDVAKVGNYGGGGAVQKLHPKKAPTLAIIKVIIINIVKIIINIIIIVINIIYSLSS